jgi:2-hydroxychromene-2-carboxylate isomerase
MTAQDRLILLALGVAATVCIGVVGLCIRRGPLSPRPQLVGVNVSDLIGDCTSFRGSRSAPFTLVEFGDYQCPPCARVEAQVRTLAESNITRIRVLFRNLPLSFHFAAENAAIVAEIARMHGKFWPVHDALFAAQLNLVDEPEVTFKRVCANAGLSNSLESPKERDAARHRLDRDRKDAATVGVNGTPTFFLCCPGNKVFRVPMSSLHLVREMVQEL